MHKHVRGFRSCIDIVPCPDAHPRGEGPLVTGHPIMQCIYVRICPVRVYVMQRQKTWGAGGITSLFDKGG